MFGVWDTTFIASVAGSFCSGGSQTSIEGSPAQARESYLPCKDTTDV